MLSAAYFPLVAALLPKWVGMSYDASCQLVVYLISGSGTPRSASHAKSDNATAGTARLIERFVNLVYPGVTVVCLHSTLDILRYGDNIRFVDEQLRPRMATHRQQLAQQFGDQWVNCFRTTLSMTDGASARVSAIHAALREYRPALLHMAELKRFFNSGQISFGDVDFHEFETWQTRPAQRVEEADSDVRRLQAEMLRHKARFDRVRGRAGAAGSGVGHELDEFWLRKSKKAVLAVLMVCKPGAEEPSFFVGMNIEVSMPTGTLCAERNAIGSALASDPSLRRRRARAHPTGACYAPYVGYRY